jgi:predicted nucleic acid-binding protein
VVAFIDANIPLYSAGAPHPYADPCKTILRFAADNKDRFVSSAEVTQELLNVGIRRRDLERARLMIASLEASCGLVESISANDVRIALEFDLPRLSARDRIDLAVMQRLECAHIVTTDRAFDGLPGITRVDPGDFDTWSPQLSED